MLANVARDFPSTHGEPNQRELAQMEVTDELMEVFGKSVVVVARAWLARLAETTAVIGNDAMAGGQQRWNLPLPRSAAQRIPVDEYHRIAGAMVFVIETDVARIFLTNMNLGHGISSFKDFFVQRELRDNGCRVAICVCACRCKNEGFGFTTGR